MGLAVFLLPAYCILRCISNVLFLKDSINDAISIWLTTIYILPRPSPLYPLSYPAVIFTSRMKRQWCHQQLTSTNAKRLSFFVAADGRLRFDCDVWQFPMYSMKMGVQRFINKEEMDSTCRRTPLEYTCVSGKDLWTGIEYILLL